MSVSVFSVVLCDLLIGKHSTFKFKIFILYKPYNSSPRSIWRFFSSQFLVFLLEVIMLDFNVGAVLGKLLKPLE